MKHFSHWIVVMVLPRSNGDLKKSDNVLRVNPCAGMFLAVTLLMATSAMAQNLPGFPPGAEQHVAQLMARVGPQARAWIAQEARREAAQPEFSEQRVIARVRANFALSGNLGGANIEELIMIVMMEIAKSAREDLKSIMAGVKSINDAKAWQRQNLTKVRSKDAATQLRNPPPRNSAAIAQRPAPAFNREDITVRPIPKAQLDSQIDKAKNDIDSMSEMGEMESLRLQMSMDRLSKMMSTLSNLMKKMSDTASGITPNIK